MEKSIAEKIKLLNYESDKFPMLNKFMVSVSLMDSMEMERILAYLQSKGIIISKPSQQNVLLNSFDFIQNQVESMEKLGALGAYVEDPSRINCKSAVARVEYLQKNGIPIVSPEGKFLKIIFKKREFEAKYGLDYLQTHTEAKVEVASEPIVVSVPEVPANIIDDSVLNSVVEDWYTETTVKEAEEAVEVTYEDPDMVVYANPIEEILSKPQTIGLNDETFERYEKLSDGIRHVMVSVYNIEEINDSITDNLIKLVTNEVDDDSLVMYYAITYGKTITDEEVKRLKSAISEELEYTSILELDMRVAA